MKIEEGKKTVEQWGEGQKNEAGMDPTGEQLTVAAHENHLGNFKKKNTDTRPHPGIPALG